MNASGWPCSSTPCHHWIVARVEDSGKDGTLRIITMDEVLDAPGLLTFYIKIIFWSLARSYGRMSRYRVLRHIVSQKGEGQPVKVL
jgi:hypothetical protein